MHLDAAYGMCATGLPWRLRCGPLRVALNLLDGGPPGRHWNEAGDGPADLLVDLEFTADKATEGPPRATGLAGVQSTLDGQRCTGHVDWSQGRAHLRLATQAADGPERIQTVAEAVTLVCSAWVWRLGGVLVHAAALAWPDGAVLVAGNSGAGKTTLARRFSNLSMAQDMVFVVPQGEAWQLWRSSEYSAVPANAPLISPLRAVYDFGSSRSQTRLEPLGLGEAVAALLPQVVMPELFGNSADLSRRLLDAPFDLVRALGAGRFHHSLVDPDDRALAVLRQGWR